MNATMTLSGVHVPAARARPIDSVARNAEKLPAVQRTPPARGSQKVLQPKSRWPPPTRSAQVAKARLPTVT